VVTVHFTTGTAAPTPTLVAGGFTEFWGAVATNAEAAIYFIKIYWQGNTNTIPVVGTTTPNLTIPVQQITGPPLVLTTPLVLQGPMYYTVTKNAADTDTAALSNGGDVITLLVA
jgi:hypothetical protein